jgi:hypothetical protein
MNVQVFSVSGVYMPSPGLVALTVECQGGGGGGGGALGALVATTGMTNWMLSGGGGAGGCYARKTLPAALVLGGVTVTVGLGGVAGSASQNTQAGPGGATSFGALCLANGGGGGWSNVYSGGLGVNHGLGGQRGTGTDTNPGVGDIATWGNAGGSGTTLWFNATDTGGAVIWSGEGGGSHFGSSPPQSAQNPAGVPGVAGEFGSGGSGGASGYANGPAVGAAGGNGLCIVTEHIWSPPATPVPGCGPARVAWPAPWCPPGQWWGD